MQCESLAASHQSSRFSNQTPTAGGGVLLLYAETRRVASADFQRLSTFNSTAAPFDSRRARNLLSKFCIEMSVQKYGDTTATNVEVLVCVLCA